MTIQEIVDLFPGGKWRGDEYDCKCPAHADDKPSLSLSTGRDGKIVLCCQAGCDSSAILAARGLSWADLNGASPNGREPPAEIVYRYDDEAGNPLYEIVRTAEKKFLARLPGTDIYKVAGVRHVLYGLPELLRTKPGDVVAICEGEKDVQTLRRHGLTATTNVFGAAAAGQRSKWHDGYTAWLKQYLPDRKFAIFPDNDDPGRAHAEAVRAALVLAGLSAWIVKMEGLPEKGDITDWLADHSDEDLAALLQAAESDPEPPRFPLISFQQLLALPPPKPQVERFFDEESFIEVFGQTSHGKSLLVFDLGLSMAKPCAEWFGRRILKPGPIVWINADGGRGMVKRAVAWKEANGSLQHPFVTLMGSVQLPQAEQMSAFLAQLKRMDPPPVFVVFDTLSRCAVGADENLQGTMTQVTDWCHRLKLALGATICLIHHTDKSGAHDRGSSVVKNETDVQIRVTMDEATKIAVVHSCKAREGDHWPDFYFTLQRVRDSVVIVQADSVGAAKTRIDRAVSANLRETAIALLRDQPGGATLEVLNLQANLEPEDQRIYRILAQLIAEKKVASADDPAAPRTFGRVPKRYWLVGNPNTDRRLLE